MLLSVSETLPSHQSVAMMSQSDMSQASYMSQGSVSSSTDMSGPASTPTNSARNMISQLMAAQRYRYLLSIAFLYLIFLLRALSSVAEFN
jgi:hypothetical protein